MDNSFGVQFRIEKETGGYFADCYKDDDWVGVFSVDLLMNDNDIYEVINDGDDVHCVYFVPYITKSKRRLIKKIRKEFGKHVKILVND